MKKLIVIGILFGMSVTFSVHAANPASKEYVDQQDQKLQTQINNIPAGATYTVGQYYQGGIIFWLDPTQNYQHGLIAAIVDQTGDPGTSSGAQWSVATTTTSAFGDGPYQGEYSATACSGSACNTYKILNTPGTTYPSASLCHSYSGGGYTDWYLPSITELNLMWENRATINQASQAQSGGAAMATANQAVDGPGAYWSSTEVDEDSSSAWSFDFNLGELDNTNSKGTLLWVRCIRAF